MPSIRQYLYRKFNQKWHKLYTPSATLPAHTVDCPECGLRTEIPKLRQGQEASCPRCHHHLVRIEPEPYPVPLACAISALILMTLVYTLPFITVRMTGMFTRLTLPEMVYALLADDWGFLGLVMFALTFGAPVLFLLLCIYVYYGLLTNRTLPYFLTSTRLLTRLGEWIMVDVFFISMLVAYIKIKTVAMLTFGAAFWLMPFLALLLLRTAISVPSHWMYYQIHKHNGDRLFQAAPDTVCCTRCLYFRPRSEQNCGVCDSELFDRRPHSLNIAFNLLLAAMILYIPANLLPIMISENPMESEISTIMSGIIYMWNNGDKLIAAIIFSASVAVPTLKIISMLILLCSARFRLLLPIHILSHQYRMTEAIGRWSMIDIFVIIILMTTFHTPIARVTPGPAAIYFCIVVILTMLSAHFFDVRLLWDKHQQYKKAA
ncbi:paraquat-inducible protein A [Wielerella bovis]|uniref:paraquat-inducible protein A n=1 Tax=Wielerella bovis TaxID=2917790 RepID=UPI00201A1D5A|nr:paraquat-inducible protein A [Wielerella bovis]ULJ65355.1 paraquat-inducible protein A [Wielerella bovis]ULJ67702.1 paraquat-inducible protein A [Wielerella bovis]